MPGVMTFTLNGVTLSSDPTAPIVLTAPPDGLGVSARTNRVDAPAGGSLPLGADVATSRLLTFEAAVLGSTPTDTMDRVDDLVGAWQPTDQILELTRTLDGVTRRRRGRPVAGDYDPRPLLDGSAVYVRCVFDAIDPIWYGPTQQVGVTTPSSFGGFNVATTGINVTDTGFDVQGGGSGGDATVLNAGKADVDWAAVVNGPVVNPLVIVGTSSIQLVVTVAAGQAATLDSRTRSVKIDGQPGAWVASGAQWSKLPHGQAVSFSLRATSGTGSAWLTWGDGYYS